MQIQIRIKRTFSCSIFDTRHNTDVTGSLTLAFQIDSDDG